MIHFPQLYWCISMKVPDRLASYAVEIATKVARRCNLDPDTTQSVAGELVVSVSARVETEEEGFRLFSYAVRHTLISKVVDELRVFGPSTGAMRVRRTRQQKLPEWQRKDYTLAHPAQKSTHDMVEFLDQFSHDLKLREYVLLVVAGYTQKELIADFGYKLKQIQDLRKKIENVYENA